MLDAVRHAWLLGDIAGIDEGLIRTCLRDVQLDQDAGCLSMSVASAGLKAHVRIPVVLQPILLGESMRSTRLVPLLLLGLSAACAEAPTNPSPLRSEDPSLIISGEPDDGRHPYVGLLYFSDGKTAWTCSGTLL